MELFSSLEAWFALIFFAIFLSLIVFFIFGRSRSQKASKASEKTVTPAAETPASQTPTEIVENPLDAVKFSLVIGPREQSPIVFRFLRATNILELNIYLQVMNESSEPVTVQRIDWECWMTGFHIKTGSSLDAIVLNAQTFKPEIRIHDVLADSQVKEILWMKKGLKGYLTGIATCQCPLGPFKTRFNLLNLDFTMTEEAEEQAKQFLEESGLDDLTGALSRRYLENSLQELIDKSSERSPLAFMMIDVDNFKTINDTEGHLVGDDILKKICEEIKHVIGQAGLLVRYGGDEFSVIIQNCSLEKAKTMAETIRQNVENATYTVKHGKLALSISVGVAVVSEKIFYKALVRSADEVLNVSKRNGKNRVTANTRKIHDA